MGAAPFSLVGVELQAQVAGIADENRRWTPVRSCSMVSLTFVEGVLGLVFAAAERRMRGKGTGWRVVVVAVTKTSSMQQLRRDPGPVAVNVESGMFGA